MRNWMVGVLVAIGCGGTDDEVAPTAVSLVAVPGNPFQSESRTDSNGDLIVLTRPLNREDNALYRWDRTGEQWQPITSPDVPQNLAAGAGGSVLVRTPAGIHRIEPGATTIGAPLFPDVAANGLVIDGSGRLYTATVDGLVRFEPGASTSTLVLPVPDSEGGVSQLEVSDAGHVYVTFIHDPMRRRIDRFDGVTGERREMIVDSLEHVVGAYSSTTIAPDELWLSSENQLNGQIGMFRVKGDGTAEFMSSLSLYDYILSKVFIVRPSGRYYIAPATGYSAGSTTTLFTRPPGADPDGEWQKLFDVPYLSTQVPGGNEKSMFFTIDGQAYWELRE